MSKFCLAIVASCTMLTGCNVEDILGIVLDVVPEVLKGWTGQTDGQALTYQGTMTISMYDYDEAKNSYDPNSKRTQTVTNMQIEVVTEAGSEGHDFIQFAFKTPFSVSGTSVKDYQFVTYCNLQNGDIDPDGETYLTGATANVNGSTVEVGSSCFDGTIDINALKLSKVYFQVGNKLFMGTFQGANVDNTAN